MEKIILHADMDAFFASVEQVEDPSLKNKPVIIGAPPKNGQGRGVVSASSYEARKYGVYSAMPISRAYRLCPHGIFIIPRMNVYKYYSEIIMNIFHEFTPVVEPLSVDEAFLDCTNSTKLYGHAENIAKSIKDKIYKCTGLKVSIGVATNKSIAKIASDLNKPDGLCICPPGKEKEFLSNLPINKIWGVGKKTNEFLKTLGILKVYQIANLSKKEMENILGNNGKKLWELANGIDERDVIAINIVQKSISREHTFNNDISDQNLIKKTMISICDKVSYQLRKEGRVAKTAVIKIRFSDFETFTRNYTFSNPVSSFDMIFKTNFELLNKVLEDNPKRKIRLIGGGVTNLFYKNETQIYSNQLKLFENSGEEIEEENKIDKVYDIMKNKYGKKINRGSLL